MILNRNVTRVLFNTTEVTKDLQDTESGNVSFVFTTSDYLYMGYRGKFASRYVKMGTANTNAANLTVEQWDGSTWNAVKDLLDQTDGMTQDGFISWVNDVWNDSAQTPLTDVDLYWVRISTDANFSAGTTLRAVLNLFSDDNLLSVYYPELVSDTSYRPSGQEDYLPQHRAAKDEVVLKLQQRKLITGEEQILDINEVAIAAVHKCAALIVNGIPSESDDLQSLRDRAERDFNNELSQTTLSVDQDYSGAISTAEESDYGFPLIQRR